MTTLELNYDDSVYTKALYRIGYYRLVINKTPYDFSIKNAMLAHKNQYKVEHLYKRSKSGYKLEPIYLQTPDRIEAYLFLFKIALQILVLMERTARTNIAERDRGLDNLMPNKRTYAISAQNTCWQYLNWSLISQYSEPQKITKGGMLCICY